MLDEPLSIDVAQQIDVGLLAPAPQLVTDGLTASQRPGQLDVNRQRARAGKSPRHGIGDHEGIVQIGAPPQAVSLMELKVKLQCVGQDLYNGVFSQTLHSLTIPLVETDDLGSLQRP